jgi:hypothetical protein
MFTLLKNAVVGGSKWLVTKFGTRGAVAVGAVGGATVGGGAGYVGGVATRETLIKVATVSAMAFVLYHYMKKGK